MSRFFRFVSINVVRQLSPRKVRINPGHLFFSIFLAGITIFSLMVEQAGNAAAVVTFEELQPILKRHCLYCHSDDDASAGLRLGSVDEILKGSDRGPVITEKSARDSELIRRIRGISEPRMPLMGPPFLTEEEILLFERWIEAGNPASSPRTEDGPSVATTPVLESTPATKPSPVVTPNPETPIDTDIASSEPHKTYASVSTIFLKRCVVCHSEKGLMGPAPEGYLLTSHAATLTSLDRVRVVPGNPDASELWRRINNEARPQMPMNGPPFLDNDSRLMIKNWILAYAPDERGERSVIQVGGRVRLHGTLKNEWSLDNLKLNVTASTRLDKNPQTGDYVEVRGRLDSNGRVIAERIRPRLTSHDD